MSFPIDVTSFHHIGDVGYVETSGAGLVPFRVVDVKVTYSEAGGIVHDALYAIEFTPKDPEHPWFGLKGGFSLREPCRYIWGPIPDLFQFLEVAGTDDTDHSENGFQVLAEIETVSPVSPSVLADAYAEIERKDVAVTRLLVSPKDADPKDPVWGGHIDFEHPGSQASRLWGARVEPSKPGVVWVVGEDNTAVKITVRNRR